jgi:2-methylcitrate dehydratase PrpD
MSDAATALATWATTLEPSEGDRVLAQRSLLDTVAVAYAAREHSLGRVFGELSEVERWAAFAHVLDFDDLHMASTTHISAICVPVALASDGGARAYLAGAGVMARLGTALGWRHYTAGWHATCTAGAPAAAVTAAVARGLDQERTATAIALAIPAAGGVQRAFGTAAKSLQVAFAAEAGIRAARLAENGARADPSALDQWMQLVGGDPNALNAIEGGPAVPDGLAIKLYPCCYALQRPISAVVDLEPITAAEITKIMIKTPEDSLQPLIHSAPQTGLEGKFSLEYGIAAALLDGRPGFESFEDDAVHRPEARALIDKIEIETAPSGDGLLHGEVALHVHLKNGGTRETTLRLPPGAPAKPPTDEELRQKLDMCAGDRSEEIAALTYDSAAAFMRERL